MIFHLYFRLQAKNNTFQDNEAHAIKIQQVELGQHFGLPSPRGSTQWMG